MKIKLKSSNKALFFVLIPLLLVGFLSLRAGSSQKNEIKTPLAATRTPSPTPKPSPTPTPTPSPSPTPTPVPLTGYCLQVPVIFYHHIQPQADAIANKQTSVSTDLTYFEQQLAYLNDHGYTSISALDLVNALRNHAGLPSKSIVVTLDDGYGDLYTNAFPLIKRYNIHVSVLIASGLVGNPGFVTWDQLNDMKNSGLVYFIDHSWSHYSVGLADINKIHYEIETARNQIEQYLGQKVDLFGYPYGTFTSPEIEVLREDNFLGAFSTIPGSWQCDSFIMTLHRIRIGNSSLAYYGF